MSRRAIAAWTSRVLSSPCAIRRLLTTGYVGLLVSLLVSGGLIYRAEARSGWLAVAAMVNDVVPLIAQLRETEKVSGRDSELSAVDRYRLEQLERALGQTRADLEGQMLKASHERFWVGGLLLGNLFTMIGGLIMFILTRRSAGRER